MRQRRRYRLGPGGRAAYLITAVACFFMAFPDSPLSLTRLFNVENIVWDQRQNCNDNGFLLSFSMTISPVLIRQPEKYDEDVVCRLAAHNDELAHQEGGENSSQSVSLVVLMSESFTDLAGLTVNASENPLENLERLAANYPKFTLISPTFGGNTTLMEFEILTGFFNAFLPQGAIPFDHYLRRPIPSLAWALRSRGYQTVAVHPFYGWYWSRDKVYPNLGFQKYLDITQFKGAKKRGWFVSDKALVDKITDLITTSTGPYFIHAVSMQNHGPYFPNRYDRDRVEITGDFPYELSQFLQTYVTGLRDADRQFGRLTELLQNRKEPVIRVFFGDHQPGFNMELAAYRTLAETAQDEGTIADEYRLAEVPALIWSNKKDLLDAAEIPAHMSPAYMPVVLLHQMRIPLPGYMFYLSEGLKSFQVIHRKFVMPAQGGLTNFEKLRGDSYLRGLEMLQYKMLFGL